jgi:transposase-like protein
MKTLKIDDWRELISRYKENEMDIEEFCRQENIVLTTFRFYYTALADGEIIGASRHKRHIKYSVERQLEIVEAYKSWKGTIDEFLDKYDVSGYTWKVIKVRYRGKRKNYTDEERRAHVLDWITSGKTQKAYSIEHGINRQQLFYWARKLDIPLARPDLVARASNIEKRRLARLEHTRLAREEEKKEKGKIRTNDLDLEWMKREYPEHEAWRELASEWVTSEVSGHFRKLSAISLFVEKYLILEDVEKNIDKFFLSNTELPSFYEIVCSGLRDGAKINNTINTFLNFILRVRFSIEYIRDSVLRSHGLRNPVPRVRSEEKPTLYESVYSPLPYGFIEELRNILVEGKDFKDWKFAQNAIGAHKGTAVGVSPDWFRVEKSQIDYDDPDCVWRVRKRDIKSGGDIYEMWSPAKWVCLLVKLMIPVRTMQARMMDSGEADTWRYTNTGWELNKGKLAQGTLRHPHQQGVFRKIESGMQGGSFRTALFINTNKTADIAKNGSEIGYVMEWQNKELLYWLEKLRNWQEKYNPIGRTIKWTELDARYIKSAIKINLSKYPPSCFLFRCPGQLGKNRELPITEIGLAKHWYRLLEKLQNKLAEDKIKLADGTPIELIFGEDRNNGSTTTRFPLHSLRVSLITALAFDGDVPFQILSRLVGHSRMIMTLYYAKPGIERTMTVLNEAEARMEQKSADTIVSFIKNASFTDILEKTIVNSRSSIEVIVPRLPYDRTPAGWLLMHHGLCLAGGNSNPQDGSSLNLAGCYNGGPDGAIVRGGVRNCVQCRWFVTEPHYLPALVAHFNNLAYRLDGSRDECQRYEKELLQVKKRKFDIEANGGIFLEVSDLQKVQRNWERSIDQFSVLAENLVSTFRIIERCKELVKSKKLEGAQLVLNGNAKDIKTIINETSSELLQLSGICESATLYEDLRDDKAILRRSQILDTYLYKMKSGPSFISLSVEEQLSIGNEFLRKIGEKYRKPDDDRPLVAAVRVIEKKLGISNFESRKELPFLVEDAMGGMNREERNKPRNGSKSITGETYTCRQKRKAK